MNTDDIIDALNEVDDTCIKNAREPKKKSHRALWISVGTAVAACLATVLLVPSFRNRIAGNPFLPIPTPTPAIEISYDGLSFAGDFRERNNSGISHQESMWSWPWEYNFICYQYPVVEYNGITYRARTSHTGDDVSETWIGKKLTDTVAGGYPSELADSMPPHPTINCELSELKGVSTDRFLAVKYEGHEEYYVFMQDRPNPSATLGDLIADLNLTETFPLTSFGYDSERYSLTEADSNALWELFLKNSDHGTIMTDFAYQTLDLGRDVMTFTINAEALGLSNRAWTLTSGGYLHTNIEDYGYYYNLGVEDVEEIINFAVSRKAPAAPERNYTLIGEVTEIADTHIMVDDTICMKHPEDGMEFLVELNDLRLERYVACDCLKVGDHVLICHTGADPDIPNHIATAYELDIGRIDANGEIYVPE